jgi:hypothetical protein
MEDKLQEFFDKAQELNETYYGDTETLQEKLKELQEEYFGEDGYCTLISQDYNSMQKDLIDLTGSEFGELLKEQGDKLQAFLGLDENNANDQAVWSSIKALMGEDGKIPTLLDGFTTGVYQDNLNAMSQANQDLLFGSDTGLNPSWNLAIGNMATDFTNLTGQVIIPAMQSMVNANANYITSLGYVQQAAGVVFSDVVNNGIDPTRMETEMLVADNSALIDSYNNEINAVGGVVNSLQTLSDQYADTAANAISAANAALKVWAAVQGYTLGDVYGGGKTSYGVGKINMTPTVSNSGRSGGSDGSGGGGANGGSAGAAKTSAKAPASNPKSNYKVVTQF